jgi:asparagine synthase (glutamine-hydrolysing)
MCGIVAWARRHGTIDPGTLARATLTLRHRGPDHQQLAVWSPPAMPRLLPPDPTACGRDQIAIGLGHARLSIVDLGSRSHQPMLTPDARQVLAYNGELYNYRELRAELEARGRRFHTESDTEVLLAALGEWGPAATRRCNGMWAFALLDTTTRTLLLARDRYGKKPLYYWWDGTEFVAASEYKAIFAILGEERRRLDPDFVAAFLRSGRWRAATDRASAYAGVAAVPPGSTALYRHDGHTLDIDTNNALWDFLQQPEESPAAVSGDIAAAVGLRLPGEVPAAVLLSGGVDSTAIAAHAATLQPAGSLPLRWYTGITDGGNDLEHSRQMARALQVPLIEVDVRMRPETIGSLIEEMTTHYELPVWLNGNCVAMFQMYRAMAADGIRVVLDGTGGDEVFGGYFRIFGENVVASLRAEGRLHEATAFVSDCGRFGHCDTAPLARQLTLPTPDRPALVEAQRDCIERGNLPHWLVMNDVNSMAHSIEVRSPLLDYRLAKYVLLPTLAKFRDGYNKVLLRESLPASVPAAVRWRRDKQGFHWTNAGLYGVLRQRIEETIEGSPFLRQHHAAAVRPRGPVDQVARLRLFAVAELERVNGLRRTG